MTTKLALTTPTVHLNGTGYNGLARQYNDAVHAVQHAIAVLQQSAPHGRDYYVQADPAAYTKARGEHLARLTHLQTVADELEALQMALEDQQRERGR